MQVGGDDGGDQRPSLGGSATSMLMARRRSAGGTTMSEINVTPFVDVVLVLLIIFMITAPMLVRAFDVNLPAAGMRNPTPPGERLMITMDSQGRTFVNEDAVNIEILEQSLRDRIEVQGLRLAYLKADENLRYADVIRVIDIMKRAGVDQIGLNYVYPEEKPR